MVLKESKKERAFKLGVSVIMRHPVADHLHIYILVHVLVPYANTYNFLASPGLLIFVSVF